MTRLVLAGGQYLSVRWPTVSAMRMLHTSDWHIGRTFHGVDLLADQARALAFLAETVAEQQVDVVLLAGDVYDRSIPNSDAIAVCEQAFKAIRAAGAQIVVTSGNHDSATRLGALGHFAAAGGLHLRTAVANAHRPVSLRDEFGDVLFYGIPYLEPDLTRGQLDIAGRASHADVLAVVSARIREDLAQRGNPRAVVLAHAFVSGAAAAGSERSIAVGGVETVPLELFDGVDYVALGHLHSPQVLSESVRYSGSPLPYSFAERSHRKAVWLVELSGGGLKEVVRKDIPLVRGLTELTGELDCLVSDPAHAGAEDHYVSATLTDHARPVDAMRRLRQRFPYAVHVQWVAPGDSAPLRYRERVQGRGDTEVMRDFLADVRSPATAAELDWLQRALVAATADPDADNGLADAVVMPTLFAVDAVSDAPAGGAA